MKHMLEVILIDRSHDWRFLQATEDVLLLSSEPHVGYSMKKRVIVDIIIARKPVWTMAAMRKIELRLRDRSHSSYELCLEDRKSVNGVNMNIEPMSARVMNIGLVPELENGLFDPFVGGQ